MRSNGGAPLSVSVVLPCLNEARSIAGVVDEARAAREAEGVSGEVIVVDNGSSAASAAIAAAHGATVVHEPVRGYGRAYLTGLGAARGEIVVLADADGTYPLDLSPLLEPLRSGEADIVLGSRLNGQMLHGAMPWKNRHVGNPLLTGLLNLLHRSGVSDAHSGLRASRRDTLERLDLRTTGMEFASEMIVEATKHDLRIAEVPIAYRARLGESKLLPYRDGWRHIRYLLIRSPTALFAVPGAVLFLAGAAVVVALAAGPVSLLGHRWGIHASIVGAVATLVGAQIAQLGLFARTYAVLHLGEEDALLERGWQRLHLEQGAAVGGIVLVAGVALLSVVVGKWIAAGFGALHLEQASVLALTLIGVGVQVLFGSFFLSILSLGPSPRD
jgi:hypothetical protein